MPEIGDRVKGRVVTAESLPEIDQEDWPTEAFNPTPMQIGSSLGLVAIGFAITIGVSLIGGRDEQEL